MNFRFDSSYVRNCIRTSLLRYVIIIGGGMIKFCW